MLKIENINKFFLSQENKQNKKSSPESSPEVRKTTCFDDLVNYKVTSETKHLEDALAQCNIDKKKWDVKNFWVKELPGGKFRWSINCFKKKNEQALDKDELLQQFKSFADFKSLRKYEHQDSGLLLEFFCPDLHFGKLSWEEETGENYDIKIAGNILRKAADQIIQNASKFNIARILFPIGNDFLQADTIFNTTTAGTSQDVDTRHHKMFREGYKLLIEIIERLSEIAPVDVVSVPGNHDQACSLYIAEVLSCYYHQNNNVTVDSRANLRKYYRWGKNLIGFTHGDKEKCAQLPLIMATEAKKDWFDTKYRFWHLGHIHTKRMFIDENAGVLMKTFPSLSAADAWHYNKGYVGNVRSATACIFDKEKGLVAELNYNL